MRPDISEFSYGYALTDSLIANISPDLTIAPVFPSLIEEGKTGGGWDLNLAFPGLPLFLQFKMSDFMVRRSTKECKSGLLEVPFYRMHLRPRRHSKQHELLCKLDEEGELVFYVAPAFHRVTELNDAYSSKQVAARSVFIKPLAIGYFQDDDQHHVAFARSPESALSGTAIFCSEPTPIEGLAFAEFQHIVAGHMHGKRTGMTHESSFQSLQSRLRRILTDVLDLEEQTYLPHDQVMTPLQEVGYLARLFFNCELLWVQQRLADR